MTSQATVASSGTASRIFIAISSIKPVQPATRILPARDVRVWPMYRIREVDGHDDEIADALADLHRLTFFDGAAIPEFDQGHWCLALRETVPVDFAGLVPTTTTVTAGDVCMDEML